MSRKHNTKHARTPNDRYRAKLAAGVVDGRLVDVRLSDGRPASARRS